MEIEKFIENFADQFDDTDSDVFTPDTKYKHIDEWSSLNVLAIMNMIDKKYNVEIEHENLDELNTIRDLFDFIKSKAKN